MHNLHSMGVWGKQVLFLKMTLLESLLLQHSEEPEPEKKNKKNTNIITFIMLYDGKALKLLVVSFIIAVRAINVHPLVTFCDHLFIHNVNLPFILVEVFLSLWSILGNMRNQEVHRKADRMFRSLYLLVNY